VRVGEAEKLLRRVKRHDKCCYYELFCFLLIIVTDKKKSPLQTKS
jgi:hypothetical protein